MLRKDYLLAQTEMLSGLVAQLLKLRQAGNELAVTAEIETSYHELFGLDPHLISLLPLEFLLGKIRSGEYLDTVQGLTLAILLREDAINQLERGNSQEHYQRVIRSLGLFLALSDEHHLQPEQLELYEVSTVLEQIADYELPQELKFSLFHYYEDTGQYAMAEDQLHDMMAMHPLGNDSSAAKGEIIAEGISYYEWLLGQTDEELAAGNLPRAEVEEGLEQLRAMTS